MELKIKERLENYKRVMQIARRPDREEFVSVAKICALGTVLVGLIGFTLYVIAIILLG